MTAILDRAATAARLGINLQSVTRMPHAQQARHGYLPHLRALRRDEMTETGKGYGYAAIYGPGPYPPGHPIGGMHGRYLDERGTLRDFGPPADDRRNPFLTPKEGPR